MHIYTALDTLSIQYKKYIHPPVYNCSQANLLMLDTEAVPTKNLFLKDRKGKRYFLIVLKEGKPVNLKLLAKQVAVNSLRFASEENLQTYLLTQAGSVSILDIVNDSAGVVELIIAQSVFNSESLQCNPQTNTETLDISLAEIQRFLTYYQREFSVLVI